MQKARRQTPRDPKIAVRPPTACRQTVSGSISLSIQEYFSPFPHGTSSLSVTEEYLALGGGPPRFLQDFTCPAVLGNEITRVCNVSPTGLSPSAARLSRTVWLHCKFVTPRQICISIRSHPTTPVAQHMQVLTCEPVWAISLSLATTEEIAVAFYSRGYLDVSVHPVSPTRAIYSPGGDAA